MRSSLSNDATAALKSEGSAPTGGGAVDALIGGAAAASSFRPGVRGRNGDSNGSNTMASIVVSVADQATARSTGATPSTYGTALQFTATVAPDAGSETVTGTVKFLSGLTELGSCSLSGGSCTWGASDLGVAGSPYSIVAAYQGDEASGDRSEEHTSELQSH